MADKTVNLEDVARRIAAGSVRTAGKIEFVKDQGPVRRDVRVKGFKWSSDALRDLAKILWAGQRSHSYAMAALRILSKMPSSEFSPDGLLGGRGYIQSVKDMRSGLANTVELLSSFTDTVHDEINADHWAAVENKADIGGIVADANEVKKNPEGFVEGEFEGELESDEPLVNPEPQNPEVDDGGDDDGDDDAGSQLPPDVPRTSSEAYDRYSVAFDKMMKSRTASEKTAGGALDELPFAGKEPNIVDWDVPGPRMRKFGPADTQKPDVEDQMVSDGCPIQNPMEEQELLLDGLALPLETNPTDADDYRLSAVAAGPEGYSWLPGADNRKPMSWYELGVSEADMEWMRNNCQPDMPAGILPEVPRASSESLWDGVRMR